MMADTSVIDRYYAALNARDFDAYAELFTPDAKLEAPGGITGTGPAAMRAFDEGFITASSDFTITTLIRYPDGANVASENLAEGVHDGLFVTPQGDIPASGNQIGGKYVGVFELQDGRISGQRVYYDRLIVAEQMLGVAV